MKISEGDQFSGSRGIRSPRSKTSVLTPFFANAYAVVAPPIPEPTMTTSDSIRTGVAIVLLLLLDINELA